VRRCGGHNAAAAADTKTNRKEMHEEVPFTGPSKPLRPEEAMATAGGGGDGDGRRRRRWRPNPKPGGVLGLDLRGGLRPQEEATAGGGGGAAWIGGGAA
jgi:hypothetical protein